MGSFNGSLTQSFDIHRMTKSGEAMPIVDLEDLRLPDANAQKEDALRPRQGKHRRSALHLFGDILAAIADGLQPTIWFLGHFRESFQNCSCSASEIDRMPGCATSLMVANCRFSGCTPPVAVSNSAAVISNRLARVVA